MKNDIVSNKTGAGAVKDFLDKVASTPVIKPGGQRGRLLFALDATASREPTWDSACRIQGQMFDAASELGGLEIQLCHYRGCSEFTVSPWLRLSRDLTATMAAVGCLGGYTQIEKVLLHAVDETRRQKLDAVVFVGDCMEEDPDRLYQRAGQLGILSVPVFVFQEGHDPVAERVFRQVSRLSRGAYARFDANSARHLGELLRAVAVYASGGRGALEDYSRRHGGAVLQLSQQLSRD